MPPPTQFMAGCYQTIQHCLRSISPTIRFQFLNRLLSLLQIVSKSMDARYQRILWRMVAILDHTQPEVDIGGASQLIEHTYHLLLCCCDQTTHATSRVYDKGQIDRVDFVAHGKPPDNCLYEEKGYACFAHPFFMKLKIDASLFRRFCDQFRTTRQLVAHNYIDQLCLRRLSKQREHIRETIIISGEGITRKFHSTILQALRKALILTPDLNDDHG